MTEASPGPTDPSTRSLAIQAARHFYLDGWTKVEIAEALGLSRFKVTRLLNYSREAGLVHIEIREDSAVDLELSERVREALGIRRALVLDAAADEASGVSRIAADYLRRTVEPNAVVGLAWSRTTGALVDNLSTLKPCTIVQLCGVIPRPEGEEHNVELVRKAASNAGAKSVTFYAPLVVPDANTAGILRKQPGIREALHKCDLLTTAVVAVGMWAPGQSTVFDALPEEQSALFSAAGAVAETCGILFKADGSMLERGLEQRTIAVTADQLRRTGDVVAVTTDMHRTAALRALSRSGIVSTVIISSAVAYEVLN